LQNEWYQLLLRGPGVFAVSGLFPEKGTIDDATKAFMDIIRKEKQESNGHGDHFAGAGQNDRIWNSFGKHCIASPDTFLKYYSNPYLDLISRAWLGPGYRLTAQVNNVKPGGEAQVCHRDYHLGFMNGDSASQYPQAMHVASQLLTLQGAVAHMDVPLESGPTRILPFSQMFTEGFMAYRKPDFCEYFLKNYVSLPMKKGDGLFFNPALFHAAGSNISTNERMANLLQISSAFGKPMEFVDTLAMATACWDGMISKFKKEGDSSEVKTLVANLGEGYPFPTNLDRNPPKSDSMAPESEQGVLWNCLRDFKSRDEMLEILAAFRSRQAA
jgi:ectoine hydroxylase-related dioxygenase (phytanoyl-CoA dioxygenase family)